MFGPGEVREFENATVIVFDGHLIWRGAPESVNSKVRDRAGGPVANNIASNVITEEERRIADITRRSEIEPKDRGPES